MRNRSDMFRRGSLLLSLLLTNFATVCSVEFVGTVELACVDGTCTLVDGSECSPFNIPGATISIQNVNQLSFSDINSQFVVSPESCAMDCTGCVPVVTPEDDDEDEAEDGDRANAELASLELDGIFMPEAEESAQNEPLIFDFSEEAVSEVENEEETVLDFSEEAASEVENEEETILDFSEEAVSEFENEDESVLPQIIPGVVEQEESDVDQEKAVVEADPDFAASFETIDGEVFVEKQPNTATGTQSTVEEPNFELPPAESTGSESETSVVETTFQISVLGQAYVFDLGLSEYLHSKLLQKYPSVTDVGVVLDYVEDDRRTVHYNVVSTFASSSLYPLVENANHDVEKTIHSLLLDENSINEYWGKNEGIIGTKLSIASIEVPELPEPVILINDVILRNFTVTVEGLPTATDLGLPAYFYEKMSVTYPAMIEKIYLEMYDYSGGNDVNYMGYINFTQPVNPKEIYEIQYELLQDMESINNYYKSTVSTNGPLTFKSIDVHYEPEKAVDGVMSERGSFISTQYNIQLADFVLTIAEGQEQTYSSVMEDLGLSDYLEDQLRELFYPEIIDVQLTLEPANLIKPNEIAFHDNVALFSVSDGSKQHTQKEVIESQAKILNVEDLNEYWATVLPSDMVNLVISDVEVTMPVMYLGTKPWVIAVSVASAVVALALVICFMPRK